MKLLIVGARGYVGSHVTLELLSQGHEVHALVRDGESAPTGTRAVAISIAERERLSETASEYDAVGFFAASQQPAFSTISNAAVRAILNRLSRGQRFAMQGGSVVFGDTGSTLRDEKFGFHPPTVFADRAAFEIDILQSKRISGPACSVVYGSLVHGGRAAMIPSLLLHSARLHGSLVLPPTANVMWSSVHIQDWAQLIVHTLCGGPSEGGTWLAAGPLLALEELIAATANLCKLAAPLPSKREEMAYRYGVLGHSLMMNQCFYSQKAQAVYGWYAKRNNWRESLSDLYAQTH
jgi:nucleoside-diphosphate-sugar epimerase